MIQNKIRIRQVLSNYHRDRHGCLAVRGSGHTIPPLVDIILGPLIRGICKQVDFSRRQACDRIITAGISFGRAYPIIIYVLN